MYAVPNFPYDPHNIYNRNQLGALDATTLIEYIVIGFAGLMLWGAIKRTR